MKPKIMTNVLSICPPHLTKATQKHNTDCRNHAGTKMFEAILSSTKKMEKKQKFRLTSSSFFLLQIKQRHGIVCCISYTIATLQSYRLRSTLIKLKNSFSRQLVDNYVGNQNNSNMFFWGTTAC